MPITRVGCYERVSTEEQALRGYSIETQIDNLTEYCKANKLKIVDHYTDEGISGAKSSLKRPAMARLLDDVKAGKIDMILFTKLDRWFRNVKEYFKVQEILEKHNVEWKTIHEDYDTTTANGKFAITMFLAIAQNERDRTSERIKVVFEHKVKNGEVLYGDQCVPWGYKGERIDGKLRMVKDPEVKQACEDFWEILLKYNNLNKAIRHVYDTYGISRSDSSWRHTIKNEMYCGMYRGVEDYCEPYITKKEWLHLQEKRPIKKNPVGRTYLFRGLVRCPVCGGKMVGSTTRTVAGKEHSNYRCKERLKTCEFGGSISEVKIESYLLTHIQEKMENEVARIEAERKAPKPKPKTNIPALKERARRLNVMYMAGNKTDEEYIREDAEIKALIKKAEAEAPPEDTRDLDKLKNLLETDIHGIYEQLDLEHKQRFWLSLIKEIRFDENRNISHIEFNLD